MKVGGDGAVFSFLFLPQSTRVKQNGKPVNVKYNTALYKNKTATRQNTRQNIV